MAELVDFLPKALVTGQESIIGLKNLLLVFLQYLCSLPPFHGVLNFGKIENLQELVQLQGTEMSLFYISGPCSGSVEDEK